ncbi:hypothetical protein [Actinokineospora globicatena]|uniref:Uncharacterized protein n=1 Tax=Actinokineospora globicatena TaxID=103729 RepID=A0A9W6QNK5_9PSEU|nr:hypothetical protein [Actinokineospora globicatena]MCP2304695.1 hypothetical protein [Actinokineospora globicatena]GLW77930.1 hypothetical protein Aglo01_24120 [Actinokineospora globicatena]GLW85403.1 hypothetical protein Aglo02_30430 [Actinokineospora globicatena]GLW94156.1 hypothetical protein Aglo03_49720 [Actinokineospora globicatena]
MTAQLLDPKQAARPLALDTNHLGALQMVARGEVGAYGAAAALRHRTDDLGVLMVSALFTLRRDGFVGFGDAVPDPRDGWLQAGLTSAGERLLDIWLRRGRRSPDEAARTRDWFVLLRCAQRGDLGMTEANQVVDRGTPVESRLAARMRELVSAGHLVIGAARLRDCRMITLSDTGRALHSRLDLSQSNHG